jgi:hypothetical protein
MLRTQNTLRNVVENLIPVPTSGFSKVDSLRIFALFTINVVNYQYININSGKKLFWFDKMFIQKKISNSFYRKYAFHNGRHLADKFDRSTSYFIKLNRESVTAISN